jgi:hypothetical protein
MRLRYQVPAPLQRRFAPALNPNMRMLNRNPMLGRQRLMQTSLQGSLANQRLALAAKEQRLRSLNMAELRIREQTSKAILDRADRERKLASGHLTGSKTWRSPAALRRFGAGL